MKKNLKNSLIAICCLFSFSAFIWKDDPFSALLQKLDAFSKSNPQEKVYLHFDKPYYAIGDNIWFKAYVTDAKTSLPTTKSNILYVELITERDSVARQIKLPMQSGITWGDFKISDSLSEGNYRIRAYTQWMRNAGTNLFFDKMIKIGNGWTNKVYTHTEFKYTTENNQEHSTAKIKFTNSSASPFNNSQITYQVILGNKKSAINKTVTDANGEINVNVNNGSIPIFKGGYIAATITLPDGFKTTKIIPVKAISNKTDVQFFPEGGNLVEGLPCKIAFKAINGNGLGESVSGIVIDNEGAEVLSFESIHQGMGSFALTPSTGKSYTAKVKFRDGSERTIALPKSMTSGYVLTVNNIDSAKMSIKIMLTPDLLNKGELNLLLQHYGQVLFSGKVPTAKQIAAVVVPKTSFPSGIAQLTLFNPQSQPVAERLTFINNVHDKIELTTQNLKSAYSKKGLVDLSLMATNAGKVVQGSFSVAVTNTNVVIPDPENESNILTSLLLTGDLTGYVEQPNYYFLHNDIETKIKLDHLLLTQGWRKINWSDVNNPQAIVTKFPAEKAMKISGVVTNNGKPVVNGKVSLMSSSSGIFATDTQTDASGRFTFNEIAFNEGTKFAIKAVTNTDKQGVKITMDDLPPQLEFANKNYGDIEVDVNEKLKSYLKQSTAYFDEQEAKGFLTRVNQLKSVEIVAKVNKASPNSSNLNGPGNADYAFNETDLKNVISLSQYLQGRVPGILIDQKLAYSTRDNGIMTVILDGVTVIDGQAGKAGQSSNLDDIIVSEIESVEVLKSIANTTIYGHAGANGIIIVTSKPGRARNTFNTRAPGMFAYNPQGFYRVREFYSPKYDVQQDPKPDYRPTVFWDPNMVSDANGKAGLKYYNTDQPGTYRIVIEGFDGDGNLARKVLNYTVN